MQTSDLLSTLISRLDPADQLIVQDLLVMHTAERGNACWTAKGFSTVLKELGFESTWVEEPTTRGNQWFTLIARLTAKQSVTRDGIQEIVRRERLKQLSIWKELGSLVESDSRVRHVALIDFDLQLAALQTQLAAVSPQSVPALTGDRQNAIARATFTKHLSAFDLAQFVRSITPIDRPAHFRDRANNQDALEEFLIDDTPLVVIAGGPFMGKTYLAQEVLARRAHDRQPFSSMFTQRLASGTYSSSTLRVSAAVSQATYLHSSRTSHSGLWKKS